MSITLDPGAPGRQFGSLCVPLGERHGAADRLDIPVAVIGRGEGPIITIVGGSSSPAALYAISTLMRTLDVRRVQGRVQLVPTWCSTVLRDHPPTSSGGSASGSLSTVSLEALDRHLLSHSTLVLQLGGECSQHWCDVAAIGGTGERCTGTPVAEAALVAFGAPFSLRREDDAENETLAVPFRAPIECSGLDIDLSVPADQPERPVHPPALDRVGARCRVLGVDALAVYGHDAPGVGMGSDRLQVGVRNVLIQAGVLDAPFQLCASRGLRLQRRSGSVRAPCGGWLQHRAPPGKTIHRGDVLALIHDPEMPQRQPTPIAVPYDGVLLSARREGRVRRGDHLATIAESMPA